MKKKRRLNRKIFFSNGLFKGILVPTQPEKVNRKKNPLLRRVRNFKLKSVRLVECYQPAIGSATKYPYCVYTTKRSLNYEEISKKRKSSQNASK